MLVVVKIINKQKGKIVIYLYVKQHSKTKLKYFGKTVRDPYSYNGSGLKWLRHIKKHGKEFVETLEVWAFDNQEECTEFALNYSKVNDIIESKEWANLKDEDGLMGWGIGNKHRLGKPMSEETKRRISESHMGLDYLKGRKQTPDHVARRVDSRIKSGRHRHTDETKSKISEARGETITVTFANGEEILFKSKSQLGRHLGVTRTTALNIIRGVTPLSNYNIKTITATTAVAGDSYSS